MDHNTESLAVYVERKEVDETQKRILNIATIKYPILIIDWIAPLL